MDTRDEERLRPRHSEASGKWRLQTERCALAVVWIFTRADETIEFRSIDTDIVEELVISHGYSEENEIADQTPDIIPWFS